MENLQLLPIGRDGCATEKLGTLSAAAEEACKTTAELYERVGFCPPWIGYLAIVNGEVVGTCAFSSPAEQNEIEIAYYTFPGFEGRGIATAMAAGLVEIARATDPHLCIKAHTLPQDNASTSVLRKLAFELHGAIEHPVDGTIWLWRLPSG